MRDYRDVVIEAFADGEGLLFDRLADVIADRDTWKMIAFEAMHHAADLAQQLEIVDRKRAVYRKRTTEEREAA